MEIVLGVLLLIAALFLIVAVLMQSGKSKNLSGTIAGGAETFFGKSKAATIDKKLSTLTTIVAIVFVVLVVVVFVIQPDANIDFSADTTGAAETTAAPAETTAAPAETTAPADTTAAA